MSRPTWDNVSPLVAEARPSGRSVQVTFRCPVSGTTVSARANAAATAGLADKAGKVVKRSLLWSLRGAVSSLVRGIFGYGILGRLAGDLAYSAVSEVTRETGGHDLSESERRNAILAAFETVRNRFVWDRERGAWVSTEAAQERLGAFQQLLASHPVTHNYDKKVLGRMLVEITHADARVDDDEIAWLTELLGAEGASVADARKRAALSDAELRAVSAGPVRRSLLASAWVVALVDEHFDPREADTLRRWATALGLGARDLAEVQEAAQSYILEEALDRLTEWGGHDAQARQQLLQLAQRIGMTEAEALEAEARHQRRRS
jgi:tellurite resistance protein